MGIRVGWDIYANPWFQRVMPVEYSVPSTPPAPAAGAAAVSSAPPKTTLDWVANDVEHDAALAFWSAAVPRRF